VLINLLTLAMRQTRNKQKRRSNRPREKGIRRNVLVRGSIKIHCPMNVSFSSKAPGKAPGAAITERQLVEGDSFNTHTGIGAAGFIQVPTNAGIPVDMAFALADLAQKASWEAIFDQYRIDDVKVHVIPVYNVVDAHSSASPNNGCPPSVIVLDYDDSTSLATFAAGLEYDNAQIITPYQGCVINVKPKITPAVYAGGVFTGYEVKESDWIDVASDTVVHYGVKMFINPLTNLSTETLGWYVYAAYTVSFKNTR